jgi:putative transcription factor
VIFMICEMCGKNVTFLRKVTIEGVTLEVCPECAKFGIEAKKEVPKEEAPRPIIAQRLEVRERRGRPKDVLEKGEKEDLVEDYGSRIRLARERAGMTQKDLAMKINERVTILSKIESNQMRPDEKVISKLQKELGIVLKEKVPEVVAAKESTRAALTLADLIKMQKE